VEFSSQNNSTTTSGTTGTSYTVGIKKYTSIRRKAARKYNDDILQVKDVLRGQITFPDEATLVCGLYSLNDLCAQPQPSGPKEAYRRDWPKIEIVRLKNLFRVSPLGNYFPSSLPTGYRHILVNIRLGDTIIAGKFLIVFRCRDPYDNVGLTHISQKYNFNSLRSSIYWAMKVTLFIKNSWH
jgi:hypothetical protein